MAISISSADRPSKIFENSLKAVRFLHNLSFLRWLKVSGPGKYLFE